MFKESFQNSYYMLLSLLQGNQVRIGFAELENLEKAKAALQKYLHVVSTYFFKTRQFDSLDRYLREKYP